MSYNSKYKGAEVDAALDLAKSALQEHQDISRLATKVELQGKVDKIDGKQLSTEDFTTLLKERLEGLSNYDDTEIQASVSKLRTDLDTLVSGDTTTAIKTFNEVIAFLDGLEDTEDLASIIASIEQQIAAKQDAITDLDTIRSGASKGATAVQSHQDISHLATKEEAVSLSFTDLSASSWVSDSTYTDYPYRCDLACAGVTSDDYADVAFSVEQVSSGDYAPVCETKTDVVSIWSAVNTSITIPTIIIIR